MWKEKRGDVYCSINVQYGLPLGDNLHRVELEGNVLNFYLNVCPISIGTFHSVPK